MGRRLSGNGGGGALRAKTFNAKVPLVTGLLTTVSGFGLLAPVTFARTGGNANLALASNGQISATAALAAGATQTLNGTATGADGVVLPFTANLTGTVFVPAAPTVTLTVGNSQVSIAWVDGSNGGASITAHRIYVNGTPMLPIGSVSPYVLTGLANGVAVEIRVSAINSAGEGDKSAAQSATPLNITNISPPTISGTLTNGSTLTCTPGVWAGGTPTRQWYRDGVAIAGATGLTYTWIEATDAGRDIRVTETVGMITATSNALISGQNTLYYATTFAGTDGTQLNGYDGWTGPTTTAVRILSNDLWQYAGSPSTAFIHAAGSSNHEIEAAYEMPVPGTPGDAGNLRDMFVRYTDGSNYVRVQFQGNGHTIMKAVAGVVTTIQTFASFSRNLVAGDIIKLAADGNYFRVYLNGVQTSWSAAQNGGLGYNISDVALGTNAGLRFNNGGTATFPFKVLSWVNISAIPSNRIDIISAAVEDLAGPIGQQVIRLTGVVAGSVTQLHATVIGANGAVLLPWANVSGLSGSSFNSVTAAIPQVAQGTTVTVWLRDATNKNAAFKASVAVPIAAQQMNLTVGINTTAGAYSSDDLFSVSELYTKKNGSWREIWSPQATDVMDDTIDVSYVDKTVLGITNYGFPTKFPNDRAGFSSNPAVDFPFYVFPFATTVPASMVGTYDVTFTPGLRWTFTGGTAMTRTAYNEAAGTATIVVTSDTSANINPSLAFQGYDNGSGYVAGTMPPAGVGFIRGIKRGTDGKRMQAASKASIAGLVSKGANGGFVRFMDDMGMNRSARDGLTPGERIFRRPDNYIGRLMGPGEKLSLEQMLEICIEADANPWINIPDNAAPEYIAEVAAFWRDNLPAWMKLGVEYSNECWNTVPAFQQAMALFVNVPNFTAGSTAIADGDYIKGATSGKVRRVARQVVNSGSIGGGNAAGYFILRGGLDYRSGQFTAGEALHKCDSAGNVLVSNVATFDATDSGQSVRYVRRCEWAFDLFEATFGVGDPRLEFALAWQAAGSPSAVITAMLNERNIYQRVKRFAVAPYVGGGVAGGNLGNYNNVTFFTKAQRDVIDPAGANNPSLYKDNAFAAMTAMSSAVEGVWRTFAGDLARYCVSKGLPRTAIRPACYEYSWQHILESNTPTGQQAAVRTALGQMIRDARAGTQMAAMTNWLKNTGGDMVAFCHTTPATVPLPSNGSWGMCDAIGSEAQQPYASLAAWIAANT